VGWQVVAITFMSLACKVMRRGCYVDVTLIMRWCYVDRALLIRGCYFDHAPLLRWCYVDYTLMLRFNTLMLRWWSCLVSRQKKYPKDIEQWKSWLFEWDRHHEMCLGFSVAKKLPQRHVQMSGRPLPQKRLKQRRRQRRRKSVQLSFPTWWLSSHKNHWNHTVTLIFPYPSMTFDTPTKYRYLWKTALVVAKPWNIIE